MICAIAANDAKPVIYRCFPLEDIGGSLKKRIETGEDTPNYDNVAAEAAGQGMDL